MQQAQDFLDESNAIHAILEPLSDEALGAHTGFKNWTVDEIITHLHFWNQAAVLSLRDGEAFSEFLRRAMAALATSSLRAVEKQHLDGLRGAALVMAWHGFCRETAEQFQPADPTRRVKWAGPDMSARSSITARLMETWAHAQAIYDALGLTRRNTDRIRNIVVLGVNTYGWTFNNRGEDLPGPMPYLRLVAPSGEIWTYGEPSEAETIEGLAEEFCQVVTQSRNIADTALRVTGPAATAWMAKAQCFAGGPETPPPPGTRRKNPSPLAGR